MISNVDIFAIAMLLIVFSGLLFINYRLDFGQPKTKRFLVGRAGHQAGLFESVAARDVGLGSDGLHSYLDCRLDDGNFPSDVELAVSRQPQAMNVPVRRWCGRTGRHTSDQGIGYSCETAHSRGSS